MAQKKDFYETLEINKQASPQEIKAAYLKLAVKYHPDKNPSNKKEAEEKFKAINEAYSVLSDPEKKKTYDQLGSEQYHHQKSTGGSYSNAGGFEDIFAQFSSMFGGDIFGDAFRSSKRSGKKKSGGVTPQQGKDIESSLTITLKDSFQGTKEKITIHRMVACGACKGLGAEGTAKFDPCASCGGNGSVTVQQGWITFSHACSRCEGLGTILKNPCSKCKGSCRTAMKESQEIHIPAGIQNGQILRIEEFGDAGLFGGHPGDLLLTVTVLPDKTFKRVEDNLLSSIKIPYHRMVLGSEVVIHSIDETPETIKIPAGCQVGERVVVKKKGFSRPNSTIRGDLVVTITCDIPKKISEEAKKELLRYAEIIEENDKKSKEEGFLSGFFKKIF